jgi:hypothetical protein
MMVDSSWNVKAHGNPREKKWRRNWRMEWVASTLHTTSEHGVSSITTADAHISAAISRLNWRPLRFKWTRPFRRKKKSGFCACSLTFQLASNHGGMTTHQYWSAFRATSNWTVLLPGVNSTYLNNCSLSVDTVYCVHACLIKFLRKGRLMFPNKSLSTVTFRVLQA